MTVAVFVAGMAVGAAVGLLALGLCVMAADEPRLPEGIRDLADIDLREER